MLYNVQITNGVERVLMLVAGRSRAEASQVARYRCESMAQTQWRPTGAVEAVPIEELFQPVVTGQGDYRKEWTI